MILLHPQNINTLLFRKEFLEDIQLLIQSGKPFQHYFMLNALRSWRLSIIRGRNMYEPYLANPELSAATVEIIVQKFLCTQKLNHPNASGHSTFQVHITYRNFSILRQTFVLN